MKANRLGAAIALLIAGALVFTGCSANNDPSSNGSGSNGDAGANSATETPDAEPTPTTSTPLAVSNPFPTCAEVWPEEDVKAMVPDFGPEAIVSTDPQAMIEFAPGPIAKDTLVQATRVQECMWGVPNSDSLVVLWMAQVPNDAREAFIEGLDESAYERSTHEDIVLYSLDRTQEVSPGCIDCVYYTWYGFIDELIIMSYPANDDVPGLFTLLREAMS